MSTSELVLTVLAAVVGLPFVLWRLFPPVLRNPTAAALAVVWLGLEGLYWTTGIVLGRVYFPYFDVAVIAVIMAKPERCNFEPQETIWAEFKCAILERSVEDRLILCSYPVCWYFYITEASYWALWVVSAAQFLAAGSEPLFNFLRRHAEAMNSPSNHMGDLRVAYAFGGGGGG